MIFEAAKKEQIDKAFNKALFAAREQILTDCNYFIRVDQGILRDSAKTAVDGDTLTITYDTPYARRVYYTGTPSTDKNIHASLQWCEVAKEQFGKDWVKILEKGMTSL